MEWPHPTLQWEVGGLGMDGCPLCHSDEVLQLPEVVFFGAQEREQCAGAQEAASLWSLVSVLISNVRSI